MLVIDINKIILIDILFNYFTGVFRVSSRAKRRLGDKDN